MRKHIVGLVLVACGPEQPATVTPHVSAVPVVSSAPQKQEQAKAKDWMWELVAGKQEVYWRRPDGTCEKWRAHPDGPPASYHGVVEGDGIELTYDGNPPKLGDLVGVRDKIRTPWPCQEDAEGDWYLDESSCAEGKGAPIKPHGCLGSPEVRAAVNRALEGRVVTDLQAAIAHAKIVWTDCTERVAPVSGGKTWLNDHYLYPTLLTFSKTTVTLAEQATKNPDYKPPNGRGEAIAMGCCSGPNTYLVLTFENGVALVQRQGEKKKLETWMIDKAPTCPH